MLPPHTTSSCPETGLASGEDCRGQKCGKREHDKFYFSIDDEKFPYKGVKGRAIAKISEDIHKNLPIVEKINIKYLGTIEDPLVNMTLENTRNGTTMVLEIIPKFFSEWDLSKAM